MEFKAEYKLRYNRCKGENVIIDVLILQENSSEIRFKNGHKWISTSRLKPYLDPDAEGRNWLFLGYKISEQINPNLMKFAIYDSHNNFVTVTPKFTEAKKIILNRILKEKEINKNA